MLENLQSVPPDPILGLGKLYAADTRPERLDLGVGVFKDADGNTPIMRAVKQAEQVLHGAQTSKAYKSLGGDETFRKCMRDLVLADSVDADRVATAQTPGGTGAVHQIYELILRAKPGAQLWMSFPTWPSHASIAKHMGVKTRTYRYFNEDTSSVDFEGMMEDIGQMKKEDVLLLHGCCHNPTGANLDMEQWKQVTDLLLSKNAVPFIDIAYQGFGDGLDEDAAPMRAMAARVPQMLIALVCKDAEIAQTTEANLAVLNRLNYSFAPDHGAAVVAIILGDDALRADWMAELEEMRLAMLTVRQNLADALRQQCNTDRFDFISHHRGMFSRLGLEKSFVDRLREEQAVYVVGDSRINIAGLSGGRHEQFAKAVASALAG